jgi:hypothetical protein
LNNNKEWEAKTSSTDYVNLKDNLSTENYELALSRLKDAVKK